MGNAFRKLFNLYPGEGKKLWLFVSLIFLWSVGGYGALTLSEGMFLEHIGAYSLPKAYFALAAGLCLLSLLLLYALNRLSLPRMLFTMILSAIGAYAGAYFLLTQTASADHTWFWYLFRMLGSMIPISTLVCFWAFVDQYYDLQDGKRLFCLFNAVTFLGDSVGGGIISFGYESLQPAGLLIVFLAAMGASLPFIYLITRKIDRVLEEHEEQHPQHASTSFSQLLRTILASRFTLILMGVYFVLQLVAIVTEFNYLGSLERNIEAIKSKNITEFLGTCAAWVSLGNVVFGVLFYSRLVKKLGVNNIILIAPLFSLVIYFCWSFQDALFFAILGIVAREGMVYSFEDNNLNLLISGVPSRIKNQVRISIDSFFEPAGMLISGLLLLLLQNESRFLGLILSCVALAAVLFLRSHYAKAIFRNLVENTIRFEKKASDFLSRFSKKEKKEIEFILFSMLKQSDEKTQLLAYESLLRMGNPNHLPRILNQMNRLSLPGKLRVLELLSEATFARESVVIDRLERWRRTHAHPSLKSAIHFYFAKHGLLNPEKIVHDLENEHLGLRSAAILTFKTFPFHKTSALDLAEEKHQKLLSSTDENEICMGLKILGHEKKDRNIEIAFAYLNHPSNIVRSYAAQALAALVSPQSAEYALNILEYLSQSSDGAVRLHCLKALKEIGSCTAIRELLLASAQFRPSERKMVESIVIDMGSENSPLLLDIVKDVQLHDRSRLLAGKILGKLSPLMIKSHLFELLRIEIERAYFYYYHLHTVQKQVREQDLSILENALLTGFHSVVDFVIQLLGVANALEDCEILSLTLRGKNRKNRAHALETLEKMCDAKLFALLEPIIDERPPEDKIHAFLKSGRIPLNLSQLLDTLEQSASFVDQIVAITIKARFNTPRWKESLKKKMETHKIIFHNFAHELLETSL